MSAEYIAQLEAALARVEAQSLDDAADAIQALHPGEVKNSVTFLRERANAVRAAAALAPATTEDQQ